RYPRRQLTEAGSEPEVTVRRPAGGRGSPLLYFGQRVLHASFISPGQAAEVAEEDTAGQLVAGFADVELGPDHPAVLLDMDDLEQVEGLEDPPVVGEGVPRAGEAAVGHHHADQV